MRTGYELSGEFKGKPCFVINTAQNALKSTKGWTFQWLGSGKVCASCDSYSVLFMYAFLAYFW